jgi:hypothetical protein
VGGAQTLRIARPPTQRLRGSASDRHVIRPWHVACCLKRQRLPSWRLEEIAMSNPTMTFLSHNEARWDRILRVTLGLLLISLAFVGPKSAWGWLGLVPLITGLIGSCPLYSLFEFSTCKSRQVRAS